MAEQVHRLKDIVVEEVSLVDRAANKRKFLLVKRDGEMSELRSNGRGGFTRVSKEDDEEKRKAAEKEEAEKAAKKPPFPPPADGEVPAGSEAPAKKADASGAALAGELEEHVSALTDLLEELEGHEEEEPSDVHMKKLAGCHKGIGAAMEKYSKRGPAAKAGRKMAARRLDMFSKALSTLQSLLSELMESSGSASEHKPDAGDPQAPPKGWSPTNPSGVPTGEAGTAGGFLGKREAEVLTKTISDQTEVMKAQAKRISQLEKGVQPSNSQPAERVSKSTPAAEVSWPLDMNRPIDRESTLKSESFFDD